MYFLERKLVHPASISLKFVAKGPTDKKSVIIPGNDPKPLPEPMMTQFTDTCMYPKASMSYVPVVPTTKYHRFCNHLTPNPLGSKFIGPSQIAKTLGLTLTRR